MRKDNPKISDSDNSTGWGVPGSINFKPVYSDEKELRISFCPKCKSRDVRYVFELGNLFGIIPKMKCLDCGFDSMSFPVLVTNQKLLDAAVGKMKKKIAARKSVPSKLGTGVPTSSGKKIKKIAKKKKVVTPKKLRVQPGGNKK